MEIAIVVAFENRFEFVGDDHPDPMNRLTPLRSRAASLSG
jgi:hypothetical protein